MRELEISLLDAEQLDAALTGSTPKRSRIRRGHRGWCVAISSIRASDQTETDPHSGPRTPGVFKTLSTAAIGRNVGHTCSTPTVQTELLPFPHPRPYRGGGG